MSNLYFQAASPNRKMRFTQLCNHNFNILTLFTQYCGFCSMKLIWAMSFLILPVSAPLSFDAKSGDDTASNTRIHAGLFTQTSAVCAWLIISVCAKNSGNLTSKYMKTMDKEIQTHFAMCKSVPSLVQNKCSPH